jgi:hypothetical protein
MHPDFSLASIIFPDLSGSFNCQGLGFSVSAFWHLFAALSLLAFLLVADCYSRFSAIKQTTDSSHLTTFQITAFDSKQGNMVHQGRSTLAADIDLLHPVEATEAQASARIGPKYSINSR